MDIKFALAQEVCAHLGYKLFSGRCDLCGFPLLEKNLGYTSVVACWFCNDRKERAISAKDTLQKARLAEKGIILEADNKPREVKTGDYATGRDMFGAPL